MTKHKVLVDMDGVVVDLLPTWLAHYSDVIGCTTGEGEAVHPDLITSYGWENCVKHPEVFTDCLGYALQNAPPKAGSYVLNDMVADERLDVWITTAVNPMHAPHGHQDKLEWLESWFPLFPREKVMFLREQRAELQAWARVDDSPDNLRGASGRCYLVDAPYNRDCDWLKGHRVSSLEDAYAHMNNQLLWAKACKP